MLVIMKCFRRLMLTSRPTSHSISINISLPTRSIWSMPSPWHFTPPSLIWETSTHMSGCFLLTSAWPWKLGLVISSNILLVKLVEMVFTSWQQLMTYKPWKRSEKKPSSVIAVILLNCWPISASRSAWKYSMKRSPVSMLTLPYLALACNSEYFTGTATKNICYCGFIDVWGDFLTNRPQLLRSGNHTSFPIILDMGSPQDLFCPLLYSLVTSDCAPTHSVIFYGEKCPLVFPLMS